MTADGSEREVDTIILGTGFHVTDIPVAARIRDGDGRSLAETWDGSPQAHRGTMVAGYPNLFFLLGPNTGLGHNSVVYMAEAQAGYVVRALAHLRAHGLETVEPTAAAQRAWNESIQRRMKGTVWTEGGCSSWYLDRNGLNTTLWPDFSFRFGQALRRFDPAEHEVVRVCPRRDPGGRHERAGADHRRGERHRRRDRHRAARAWRPGRGPRPAAPATAS